jgi:predicted metal-binding membrane protein
MVRTARILEDPELAADRQTASLAGLALTLALVVAGLFLVDTLRARALQQDCDLVLRAGCLVTATR